MNLSKLVFLPTNNRLIATHKPTLKQQQQVSCVKYEAIGH